MLKISDEENTPFPGNLCRKNVFNYLVKLVKF